MNESELESVAKALVAPKKGIFAADWSLRSSEKYFEKYGIEHTEESRRKYRQLLFTTEGLEEFVSGVIFFDETFRQTTDDGTPFPQYLAEKGIFPGIKVDKGTVDLANHPGEKITEGLDGLRNRLLEYRSLGARFTKWRVVVVIGDGLPTKTAMESNAQTLALFAALSQENDLVPVVEPEVLLEGNYDLGRCKNVTEAMLEILYDKMMDHRIFFQASILKTNMVQPGKESEQNVSPQEIGAATVEAMREVVPEQVPGVVFLSGGQTPVQSTENLNAICSMDDHPWEMTFSYARALQQPALELWGGKDENVHEAQKALFKRVKLNSLARQGKYKSEMEEKK